MIKSKYATGSVDFGTIRSNDRAGTKIVRITPHHMAAKSKAINCAKYHRDTKERNASANYYISDNDIIAGVSEDRRAWTSSNRANDMSAITIEIANSTTGPDWKISDKSYNSLVLLCADICIRYGIKPHYTGNKSGTITMHKMFAATSCPGPYLEKLITSGKLEKDINAKIVELTKPAPQPKPEPKPAKNYNAKIKKTFTVNTKKDPLNMRKGPGSSYKVVQSVPKGKKVTCDGYYEGSWYHVKYNGKEGFCYKNYLK